MSRALFIIISVVFILSCKSTSVVSSAEKAADQDKQEIKVLFDKYIHAVKTGDSGQLASVFHPTAMMYGYYKQFDNNIPISGFIRIQMRKGASPDVEVTLHDLAVTGRIATLKAVSKNWNGDSYTDYYTCIKTVKGAMGATRSISTDQEQWLIASKTFFLHEK